MSALAPLGKTKQGQNVQAIPLPAPSDGLLASGLYSSAGDIGPKSAIWMFNFIATEYGCRVRNGSREIVTGLEGSASDQVRTILYFNSQVSGGALDKTFACNDAGIFDITAGGAGPWVAVLTWPTQGGNAGWVSSVNYSNVAGDHFLLVCDEANGYYIYNGTANTWTIGTFQGTPVPLATDLVQITEWHGRIWLVERDTTTAWFLDPLALTGAITEFDVGNRFKIGGHLVQTSTWTLDDGDGMDDKFVMISAGGDVLVFDGVNPTSATDMVLKGRWQVGSVPEGRRVMSDFGGDVMILSTNGIIRVSVLLGGYAVLGDDQHLSKDISRYIRIEMQRTLNDYGWSMMLAPSQGIMVVTIPTDPDVIPPIQFVMETTTSAWTMFRDLDIVSQVKRGVEYLFGDSTGRVLVMEGFSDDADLAGESSKAVTYSLLTHYSSLGNPASWKRPQFIRPYWIGGTKPNFNVQMRYDFDINEPLQSPPITFEGLAVWDTAIWDEAVWGGRAQSYTETIGVNGMGRHVAVAIRGEAVSDLSYIGSDLIGDMGGML